MQNLKIQIIMSSPGYFPQFLIEQNIMNLLPLFKLQIKWLRNTPYKISIIDVGGATGENGLSTIGLEYVTHFRDLWTLTAFKSHTQQQYGFQFSFNLGIVNCTLYNKLNLKGISALCKVYLKSPLCQDETPQN